MTYRRTAFTWTAFGALFAFGYLNALLGPALPYLRAAEHISYIVGALHQVASAIGGGLAGAISTRDPGRASRRIVIAAGLTGGALAGLAVGYGNAAPVTIAGALAMGMFATLALIRIWGAVADAHGPRPAVGMTEGEVAVSLAGVVTPLLIAALAPTAATWRVVFPIGVLTAATASTAVWRAKIPAPRAAAPVGHKTATVRSTLVIVFAIVALEFTLSFWLASYLTSDVGLSPSSTLPLVSCLYAADLTGRLIASRLARAHPSEHVLAGALGAILAGLPFLLAATSAIPALIAIAVTGAGIGALFPLTSSLHVQASGRSADGALGELLLVAAAGQITGPLLAGAIAQVADLRAALLALPGLALLAVGALSRFTAGSSTPPPAS